MKRLGRDDLYCPTREGRRASHLVEPRTPVHFWRGVSDLTSTRGSATEHSRMEESFLRMPEFFTLHRSVCKLGSIRPLLNCLEQRPNASYWVLAIKLTWPR